MGCARPMSTPSAAEARRDVDRSRYFNEHRGPLEKAFSVALNDAIVSQAPEPLLACAKHMSAQHRRSAKQPKSIDRAIRAAWEALESPAQPQATGEAEWVAGSWLAADKSVCGVIASSLLKSMVAGAPSEPTAASQLAFICTLGRADDRREAVALLLAQDETLVDSLADAIAGAAERLAASSGGASSSAAAQQLSNKFSEESFEMVFDGTEAFFAGLEGKPRPAQPAAMEREPWSASTSARPTRRRTLRRATTR